MEEIFEPILDNDEKVVKVLKPKKSVVYFKSLFGVSLIYLIFFAFMDLCILMGLHTDEAGNTIAPNSIEIMAVIFISIGVIAVLLLLQWLIIHLYYKNVYYAYTNKRVIIRKGIIGVDFKSLDIKMIGASNVNVGLFDKILRKNTGTINFGSMASPMMASNGGVGNFTWASIVDPYAIYKEIKSFIADSNETNEKSKNKGTKKETEKESKTKTEKSDIKDK